MECPDMPSPLCLVEKTDDGFTLNGEALEMISRILLPLVVVAIVGPYRTGKSFLLNRLMGKNKGFPLGSSVQAKTKGIWVWCRPHPRDPNLCLLLLDTEGLGDMEKGSPTNDSHIFALTTLLSSMLIYNSMSTLDNDAIQKLSFVSELTKLIRVRASTDEEDGTEFAQFFPDFVWAIRDFWLKLEIDDRKVTADEYLDRALALRQGTEREVSDHNRTREHLKTYFKSRKCFVFYPPVNDREKFEVLDTVPDSELNPKFVDQAEQFCQYIFSSSTVKNYHGRQLNGSSFGNLLNMYLEAFKSGKVPFLGNIFEEVFRAENDKAVTEALGIYRENMTRSLSLPTETLQELSDAHRQWEQSAMEHFRKTVFQDKENEYRDILKSKLIKEYDELTAENKDASSKACKQCILDLGANLEKKLSDGEYAKPDGFDEYRADKEELVRQYNETPRLGVMTFSGILIKTDSDNHPTALHMNPNKPYPTSTAHLTPSHPYAPTSTQLNIPLPIPPQHTPPHTTSTHPTLYHPNTTHPITPKHNPPHSTPTHPTPTNLSPPYPSLSFTITQPRPTLPTPHYSTPLQPTPPHPTHRSSFLPNPTHPAPQLSN